jgi:hypothetical protein
VCSCPPPPQSYSSFFLSSVRLNLNQLVTEKNREVVVYDALLFFKEKTAS